MFYFIGFHKVSRMAKSFQKSESRILLFRKIKPCAISLLFNLIFQIDYHESSVSQRTPEEMGWTVREFLLKNTPHFHHKINEKDIWKGLQDHAGEGYCVPRGVAQHLKVIMKKEKMAKNVLERPKHALFLDKNHRMRHGGAKSHLCEICMAAFFNDEGLTDHKRGVHPQVDTSDGGEKSFYFCSKCGKKFSTRRQFYQHVNRLHKQIVCFKCNLTVGSYPALRIHKKKCDLPIND